MIPMAGSSADAGPAYDYTEGASASDIGEVINSNRVRRQDSHYSTYYDGEGNVAMFSGPGHTVNPSSVSRMSYMELGRRSLDSRTSRVSRRDSWESRTTRHSVDGHTRRDGTEETQSLLRDDIERRKRRSPSPPPRSMLENLAHIFGRQSSEVSRDRRPPSVSERSSISRFSRRTGLSEDMDTDEGEEERWGYSSAEEDSDNESIQSHESNNDKVSVTQSMNYDSEPPSPLQVSQTLPLLGFDSVFDGEARIDMDTTFTLLDPPPPGPPSRQTIYISDEDSTIRFIGYETIPWRVWVWRICCVFTFGIVGLLGHWFPYLWLRWVARERAFINAINGFVMVEVCIQRGRAELSLLILPQSSHRAVTLLPMQNVKYPYPLTTVFQETIATIPVTEPMSVMPCNGIKGGLLDNLRVVDYRYNRFALDPRTGLFTMVRYVNSPLHPL
jgi:cation-transporting ATPase 13A2